MDPVTLALARSDAKRRLASKQDSPLIEDVITFDMSENWSLVTRAQWDTSEQDAGDRSIKLRGPYARIEVPVSARHIETMSYLHLRMKASEADKIGTLQVQLWDGETLSNRYQRNIPLDGFPDNYFIDDEWVTITDVCPGLWGTVGTPPEHTKCKKLAINVWTKEEAVAEIWLGGLQFVRTKPATILWIDDGLLSVYELAFPIMRRYPDIVSVLAIITGQVGTPGYMTWEQIREMHQAGHAVVSHTKFRAELADKTDEYLHETLGDSQVTLIEHGYRDGARFVVNPGGTPVPDNQRWILEHYYLADRPRMRDWGTRLHTRRPRMGYRNTPGDASDTYINERLGITKKWGTAWEFTLHGFTDNPAEVGDYVMHVERFEALCSAIANSGVPTITPMDVFSTVNRLASRTLLL